MTVSCIIPVFNGALYIGETIQSVLDQTHAVDEIIVVNDGSTDATRDVVSVFGERVTLLDKAHSGVVDTLNHGVAHAKGSLLTFIDADDLWHRDKVRAQLEVLHAHSDIDIVFTHIQEFISPELTSAEQASISCRKAPMRGMSKGTALIRRAVFDTIGPFDPKLEMGEFIEWFSRAKAQHIRHVMLDQVLCLRRVHLHNYTRVHRTKIQDFATIAKRAIEMKKKQLLESNQGKTHG